MSGFINYFQNNKKNMPFLAHNEKVTLKYNKIWEKVKKLLGVELESQPVYYEKYIKTRVKTFDDKVITKFTYN